MSEASFYEPRAKSETQRAVQRIEAQTSAEVVVALRRVGGRYRDADYLAGFLSSLLALVVMLFAAHPFPLMSFPAGVVAAFVLGAAISSGLAPLRRFFTFPGQRRAMVRDAARAAFVELGIGRTRGRTGVLVFVALFERDVEIIADVGIDLVVLGEEWTRAVEALRRSLTPRPTFDRFRDALSALALPLARALPRTADDVNELSDEVLAE